MLFGKDTCSTCGKYTEITAKVLNEGETLYCKECQDKELKIMLENFNQIKFYCIKCGSSKVTKNDPKTGISVTIIVYWLMLTEEDSRFLFRGCTHDASASLLIVTWAQTFLLIIDLFYLRFLGLVRGRNDPHRLPVL
jgi:hypothetical protein